MLLIWFKTALAICMLLYEGPSIISHWNKQNFFSFSRLTFLRLECLEFLPFGAQGGTHESCYFPPWLDSVFISTVTSHANCISKTFLI